MEDIVESFAERLGIEPDVARKGISITCRHFLQNSEPIKATCLNYSNIFFIHNNISEEIITERIIESQV